MAIVAKSTRSELGKTILISIKNGRYVQKISHSKLKHTNKLFNQCTGKAPLKRVFNPYIKAVLLFSLQHLCRLHLSFSKLTVQKEKTSYSDNLPFIYSNINNIPSPLMPCPNPHQVLRQSPQHDSQAPSTAQDNEMRKLHPQRFY